MLSRARNCHQCLFRLSKSTFAQKRMGHSHHDAHHNASALPTEPYAVKHHPTYPSEAIPFGLVPGKPLEGWEVITFATMGIATGLLIYGMNSDINGDFKVSILLILLSV